MVSITPVTGLSTKSPPVKPSIASVTISSGEPSVPPVMVSITPVTGLSPRSPPVKPSIASATISSGEPSARSPKLPRSSPIC